MDCIFTENVITLNSISHYRLFREAQNGERSPIFKDGKASIHIHKDGCYRVQTLDGENVYIGCGGIDEALSRIEYAQPFADVEIIEGSHKYTKEDYYRHITPVVWLIAQCFDNATNKLAIAFERRKNDQLLSEGTVIFTGDQNFADWLVKKLAAEERPPAVRFGEWVPRLVLDKLTEIELNNNYPVEIKRGTWPALRKKAQETVVSDEPT